MSMQDFAEVYPLNTYVRKCLQDLTKAGVISKVNDRWYHTLPASELGSKFTITFDSKDEYNRAVWRHQVKSNGLTPEQVEEFYHKYMWCFLYYASATGRLNFTDEPKFEAGDDARRKLMAVIQQTQKDLAAKEAAQ